MISLSGMIMSRYDLTERHESNYSPSSRVFSVFLTLGYAALFLSAVGFTQVTLPPSTYSSFLELVALRTASMFSYHEVYF